MLLFGFNLFTWMTFTNTFEDIFEKETRQTRINNTINEKKLILRNKNIKGPTANSQWLLYLLYNSWLIRSVITFPYEPPCPVCWMVC